MTKKVFLWTAPRCVSTAFERCMMEVDNSKIFHEPYSGPYHFGPERQSPRYVSKPVDHSASYDHVRSMLTKDYGGIDLVFSKDMAYAIENNFEILLDKELRQFQHTFLLRNPRKTVPSLYRASVNKALTGWESFDPHEAGFSQLQNLYDFVKENLLDGQREPVVVDSDDLLRDPESTMKAYCDSIDVEFNKDILSWTPGEVDGWQTWSGWHDNALNSSGFSKHDPTKQMQFENLSCYPKEVEMCVNHCMPFYQNLTKYKISPIIS